MSLDRIKFIGVFLCSLTQKIRKPHPEALEAAVILVLFPESLMKMFGW